MATERKWNGSRFTKSGPWKWLAVLVVAIGGLIGVALATSSGGSNPSASGLCDDKLTQMEQNGAMQTMSEQHQQMLEQMRVAITPQMQQRMDADPMWKEMLSGEWTKMFEDQQQQIDRMLGATPKCGAP